MHSFYISFITGMKVGIELLDQHMLESDGAWGVEIDLLILRFSYIRIYDVEYEE